MMAQRGGVPTSPARPDRSHPVKPIEAHLSTLRALRTVKGMWQ
ncbi:hypothetical protein [Streptomyces sp. NRRL F-5755]|nr:hypothetical protein [Streptomyces sp. NRRL F-5755]